MKAVAQTFCPPLWSLFLFSFLSAYLFWYWRNKRVALSGGVVSQSVKNQSKTHWFICRLVKDGPRVSGSVAGASPPTPTKVTQGLETAALLQHACCRHFHLVVLFWWRLRQHFSILASAEVRKRHSLLWICEVRLFLTADAADYAWQPTIDSPSCFSFITCSWTRLRHTNELLRWLLCQKTFPCCFLLFFCFWFVLLCVFMYLCVFEVQTREKNWSTKYDHLQMLPILCACFQS